MLRNRIYKLDDNKWLNETNNDWIMTGSKEAVMKFKFQQDTT